jgi:hypothetical protein
MPRSAILLSVVCTLFGTDAYGDQCAWNSEATAQRAVGALAVAGSIIKFCEPCGDKAPQPTVKIQSVAVTQSKAKAWEVTINGESVDLAYIFVPTVEGPVKNLGLLVGCPAKDVSRELASTATPESPSNVKVAPAKKVFGTLQIDSNTQGVTVSVDGKIKGRTPLRIVVPVGDHQISARLGAKTVVRPVFVKANRVIKVVFPF